VIATRSIENAIDTLHGKVERDPIATRCSVRRSRKDIDVEAEVDSAAEDLKTMGGPIAQDLLPLPRHSVFRARATEPMSQSWQRQDVDEAA